MNILGPCSDTYLVQTKVAIMSICIAGVAHMLNAVNALQCYDFYEPPRESAVMERKYIPLGELQPDRRTVERVMNRYQRQQTEGQLAQPSDDMYVPVNDHLEDAEHVWVQKIFSTVDEVPPTKVARGSVYPFARSVLLHTDADWQGFFPEISRDEVAELSRHPAVADTARLTRIFDRHGISDIDYDALWPRYGKHIRQLAPYYAGNFAKGMPDGVLSVPPYYRQINALACTVSCYRMIFSDIAGSSMQLPAEYAINTYQYENSAFSESHLFRSLVTPFFKQQTGRTVLNRVLIGATFDDIALRVQKVSEAYPGSDAYAMLAIKNFDEQSPDRLHAVLLLSADDHEVEFHNPLNRAAWDSFSPDSGRGGGAHETLKREEFVRRWAAGLYTAHIVFALPPDAGM